MALGYHKDIGSSCRSAGHTIELLSSQLRSSCLCTKLRLESDTQDRALQTCAAKGKGKQGMRQGMGAQKMGPQMPTPPPVDPDNVEFILFVRNPKVDIEQSSVQFFCWLAANCK